MKIALIGNPNCGKTVMFNALTGKNEKVGNWSGVTVNINEAKLKSIYSNNDITIVDLPGTYSLSPFTSEESITKSFILKNKPDVIINIIDVLNLSRSLFFTTQLLELEIPVVIALNKSDLMMSKSININIDLLSKKLNVPIITTSSLNHQGLEKLIDEAIAIKDKKLIPANLKLSNQKRYDFINSIISEVQIKKHFNEDSFSDKLDKILLNKYYGIPIFIIIMYLLFQISQVWIGAGLADILVSILENIQTSISSLLVSVHPLLQAILIDGVIGGVIAVIGFLPLVMVMYFLISLLEDSGYMARVAALLDPIFKRVGLSGKSVIPFVITIGCAVPGIMASRTIKDETERKKTALLAPFIPCGAKIPVIALFAGAFFDGAGWVSTLMYLLGIVLIFVVALIINKITGYSVDNSYFIIELPEFKKPSIIVAFKTMCQRGWSYIVKASTIILLCNTIVQTMQLFTLDFSIAVSANTSILATIATPFAYILLPIVGVLSWQLAAGAITGFIAKENVVGTLAVCFVGLENLINTEELIMLEGTSTEISNIIAISKVGALAYLIFNLYTPPCFAAIGAMNSEMKNRKWLLGAIGLQFAVGYILSYLVYTIGTIIIDYQSLNTSVALYGLAIVLLIIGIVIYIINKKEVRIE